MTDTQTLMARARQMRQTPTEAERRLWIMLRGRQRGGKFRRQMPTGAYIVDFACLSHRLVIEVDGDQHADNAYDVQRDTWLKNEGFRVLRFSNASVLDEMTSVLAVIDLAMTGPAKERPLL